MAGLQLRRAHHKRRPRKKKIIDAIVKQATQGLLTSYCFPNESRMKLVKKLVELAPKGLDRCFLLSTGSEADECAIKLSRTYGAKLGGDKKHIVVSFEKSFHGRTLGSQQAGGIPDPKILDQKSRSGFRAGSISRRL